MIQHYPLSEVSLAVADNGPASGPVVLLVHGFPLDHTMWDSQREALSPHARVIAPDLRGYGQSTLGQVGEPPVVTMERYADDLAALLDTLEIDQPVVFVGFSMGGYIGWQFYRKHRQRVRAMVLCDTRAGDDTAEARANRHKMADHVAQWGAERVAEAMLPKLFAESSIEAAHPMVEQTRRVIAATSPLAIAAAQRGMAARPDATADLPQFEAPLLAIVGEHDQLSPPEEMQRMVDQVPNGRLVVVPQAGHMAPVENPDAVSDPLVAFVRGL